MLACCTPCTARLSCTPVVAGLPNHQGSDIVILHQGGPRKRRHIRMCCGLISENALVTESEPGNIANLRRLRLQRALSMVLQIKALGTTIWAQNVPWSDSGSQDD